MYVFLHVLRRALQDAGTARDATLTQQGDVLAALVEKNGEVPTGATLDLHCKSLLRFASSAKAAQVWPLSKCVVFAYLKPMVTKPCL